MILKNIAYRKRLKATAIGISVLLLLIGLITRFSLNDTFKNFTLVDELKDLSQYELKMRKMEKDFLLTDTENPKFFESGHSDYVSQFNDTYNQTRESLKTLNQSEIVRKLHLEPDVLVVENLLHDYKESFINLVHHTRVKGFKDYGLIGKMRSQIHSVEHQVKLASDEKANVYMLTLRRHEKDYLLRHDLKYKIKFEDTYSQFVNYIAVSSKYNRYQADALVEELKNYKGLFFNVIEKDKEIGLTGEGGVLATMTTQANNIENELQNLHFIVYDVSESRVRNSIMLLFVIIGILSLAILLIIYSTSQEIMNAIDKLRVHVKKLGIGNLPEKIKYTGKNEVTEMMESINTLTANLKNTKQFAQEVGEGKLETQVDVFGNKGDLGGSLVEMRNRLLKVAQERDVQSKADKIQLWINDGLAQFADIIRLHSREMDSLTFQFVKKLVNYLDANQGGIFVRDDLDTALHDPENTEVRFVAKALYAYGRRKFCNAEFGIGEGISGTCAQEGETVYITEIPDEYVEITSGLGKAKPKAILLVAMKADDSILGIIEIASFKPFEKHQIEFVEIVAGNLASNLLTVSSNVKTQFLLEQSRMQANELAAQEEELRQNMEELTTTQEAMSENETKMKQQIKVLTEEKRTNELKLKQELELQKLEAEENRLKIDIINMNVLIGELTPAGQFISVNGKFEEVLEYTAKEISAYNIRNFISEDETHDFDKVWKRVTSGIICDRLGKRESKTGKKLWLKTSYAPLFDKFGELEKVFFVAKDVTLHANKLNVNSNDREMIDETRQVLEDNLKYLTDLKAV